MKKHQTALPVLALFAALPATAGVVITSETMHQGATGAQTRSQITTSTEGNRQRVDDGSTITIFDLDRRVMLTLTPATKLYRETPLDQSPAAMGVAMAAKVKYTAKGTHQTIAGSTCDEYAVEMGAKLDQTACVAKAGPGTTEYVAFARKFFEVVGSQVPASIPQGVTLSMEVRSAAGGGSPPIVSRVVVASIKTQSVPASAFEVPAGYKKDTSPDPMAEMMKRMKGAHQKN